MISNRGVLVWPNGHPNTFKVDHWRCRFMDTAPVNSVTRASNVVTLLSRLHSEGVETIKTENLYNYDGEAGFSKGQGQ